MKPYYEDEKAGIVKGRPGPKPGYKQTKDHIEKRKRFGPEHHAWVGDMATIKTGRGRAIRAFDKRSCQECGEGKKRIDRHHIDGNTLNNSPSNIKFLCRKCHMMEDGRLSEFTTMAIKNLPTMRLLAAKSKAQITHCPKGHPYSGDNLYINTRGARTCRRCLNDYKRKHRAANKTTSRD